MRLVQINPTTWEIPRQGPMHVPGRIIADERVMPLIQADKAAEQVANVACLPGIVSYALAMPDAHWGYGFPIGGVAATDPLDGGVVSPGGVGYDINCGVRLMTTCLFFNDIRDRLRDLVQALYHDIPTGVGSSGAIAKLSAADLARVLEQGSAWAVNQGYGSPADLDATEENGCLRSADAKALSPRALARGLEQLGTLGSGNHFVELSVVETIYDTTAAQIYGLSEGQLVLWVHSGSRGLGYQVCDDFLHSMQKTTSHAESLLKDRQLCCAPVESPAGRQYLAAMAAAANYAWANRQVIMELARRALMRALDIDASALGARLLYDVCHNIAKLETHIVQGKTKLLCVHRKGATRAFDGSRPEIPARYSQVGQPVLIPGDMGRASYVCTGTQAAMDQTFGSCCHGAGRVLSRTSARKNQAADALFEAMDKKGIVLMARSRKTVAEECPEAYKDVDVVVDVVHRAGIGKRVARLRPVGVIKG